MRSMMKKKCIYFIIAIFALTLSINSVNADVYENYFGINMTSEQYNNLLNLGFSENEIYYMSEETFEINKDLNATLLTKNQTYYKTIYTDLNGNPLTTEITKNEYENQSPMNARGTIVTEYKTMVTTISQNGNYFRYKVSLGWNNMPSTRSYDIIGIGFDDPVYIYSPVYFAYAYCFSDGSCTSSADYYHRTKTSTGGSVVYKLPTSNIIGLEAVLYYDVAKNTSNTITCRFAGK